MTRQVILTGLRANNDLTLGNYFGGMLPIIDMAKTRSSEFQVNMFIPDLHSFTTPINHNELHEQIMHNARLFTAAGLPLDNDNIHLYRQSYVPAHSELTWILDCFTGFGEMSRMTQFKDKAGSRKHTENMRIFSDKQQTIVDEYNRLASEADSETKSEDAIQLYKMAQKKVAEAMKLTVKFIEELGDMIDKEGQARVGLFNYPVLMAADILLYGAKYVPVGDDQTQHLEFTRDIAERMNSRFGELFTVPESVKKQHEFFGKDQGLRIMDLQDPTKKMSKSDDTGKGVIFLGDEPEAAAKKIMSAATDDVATVQIDRKKQPGITNLLEILALLRGKSLEETATEFEGVTRYGDFKKVVAEEVKNFLTDFQARLAAVDDAAVLAKLEASEATMNQQAGATLYKVQQAVGLRAKDA